MLHGYPHAYLGEELFKRKHEALPEAWERVLICLLTQEECGHAPNQHVQTCNISAARVPLHTVSSRKYFHSSGRACANRQNLFVLHSRVAVPCRDNSVESERDHKIAWLEFQVHACQPLQK